MAIIASKSEDKPYLQSKLVYNTAYLIESVHLEEHPACCSICISLGSVLHRVGRLRRDVRNRAAVGEEQNLDRDGQTGVQSDHDDEENAGGFRVDG